MMMSKPQVMINATVEHIEGNLAIISIGAGRKHAFHPPAMPALNPKKYLILVRQFITPAASEGLSLHLRLGKDSLQQASPDLEKTLQEARLLNEAMEYMSQALDN